MLHIQIKQRPPWQRAIFLVISLVVVAALLWIGLIVVIGLALLAVIVAIANKIKLAITGKPLFKTPSHFHRYQSQFKSGDVIEGEVISPKDPKDD
ncbi:hypothetical protein KO489_05115 [Reinekea forsetii]|nr:hypothetical protein [Reinekea forsetii]